MSLFAEDDELVRRAIAEGRTLGRMASHEEIVRRVKAIEAARERAKHPAPPIDPRLPKWWEYEDPKS